MASQQARIVALAQAQFASTMAESPNLGPFFSRSYKDSLLRFPLTRTLPKPQIHTYTARSDLVRRKVAEIRRSSSSSNPICMKCGSRGHLAAQCRNAPLCFICNKHGHKGVSCHSVSSPSFHPAQTERETETVCSHDQIVSSMAPPSHRRGYSRSRPYQPGGRPPGQRGTDRQPPFAEGQAQSDRSYPGGMAQPTARPHIQPPLLLHGLRWSSKPLLTDQ